jgi:hypothetical protein
MDKINAILGATIVGGGKKKNASKNSLMMKRRGGVDSLSPRTPGSSLNVPPAGPGVSGVPTASPAGQGVSLQGSQGTGINPSELASFRKYNNLNLQGSQKPLLGSQKPLLGSQLGAVQPSLGSQVASVKPLGPNLGLGSISPLFPYECSIPTKLKCNPNRCQPLPDNFKPTCSKSSDPNDGGVWVGGGMKVSAYKKYLENLTVERLHKIAKSKGVKITKKSGGKTVYVKKATIVKKLCEGKYGKK